MAATVPHIEMPTTLKHLTPAIGTEVHGITLSGTLEQSVIDFLAELLVARKVLFFRDQHVSLEDHIAFAA